MKRFILAIFCLTMFAAMASAQDFQRFEAFGGYSLLNQGIDPALAPVGLSRINAHGFEAAFTANPTNKFGLVADFTSGFSTMSAAGVNIGNLNTYTYLFGPRFTPVRGKVVTPWMEFLVGAAHGSFSDNLGLDVSGSQNAFAFRTGGGLDLKLTRTIASRTEVGWENTRFDLTDSNHSQNHFHFATGIAFKFGK